MSTASRRIGCKLCLHLLAWLASSAPVVSIATGDETISVTKIEPAEAQRTKPGGSAAVMLDHPAVTESSGLAFSNLNRDRLWTHNDSGDTARLFAFDRSGKSTGGCRLVGVDAIDFEDMAAFQQDSVARLVVADVGDNGSVRPLVSLYFFDEPDPDQQTDITAWTRIDIRYADGPRDCEAIMVDPQRSIVTLVTKSFLGSAGIYELPLPPRLAGKATSEREDKKSASGPAAGQKIYQEQTVRRVATLTIPLVTAADRDPASGEHFLTNYFQLFRFPASEPERPWWESSPTATDLPRLKQIEAIAIDAAGDVWVTSEASPTPLAKIKVTPPPKPAK